MKPPWRSLLLGVVAYALFLLLNTPAPWLLRQVDAQRAEVRAAGVQGTLWSGSAARLQLRGIPLTGLHWRWRPGALLAGRIEFALDGRFEGEHLRARAGRSLWGRFYLAEVKGRLDPQALVVRFSRAPLELGGRLALDLRRVRFADTGPPLVEGRIDWPQAVVIAPLALDLGRASLVLAPAEGKTHARLQADGGQLAVDGELSLDPAGDYALNTTLRALGPLPDAVARLLQTLAEYRDGAYHLRLSGHLSLP